MRNGVWLVGISVAVTPAGVSRSDRRDCATPAPWMFYSQIHGTGNRPNTRYNLKYKNELLPMSLVSFSQLRRSRKLPLSNSWLNGNMKAELDASLPQQVPLHEGGYSAIN
jgi:hypothetical protein